MITTECQEYLTEGTLRHGLHVDVRPLCRDDRLEVVEGFAHISAESRYRRFLSGKPRLTAGDLRALFDSDQLALVLVWPRSSCPDIVLGIAQAIPLRDRPDTCEFSILLADEIHGQGAGRLLTRELAQQARNRGVTHLTGYMLATNEAPVRLLAGVGEVVHDRITSGAREMEVEL